MSIRSPISTLALVSRRGQIKMSDTELAAFLADQRIMTCATIGPSGRPHLISLWFVPEPGSIACWTYANSQKAKNLRRLALATVQFEAGESYAELRGAMMECDAELIDDLDEVTRIGLGLTMRYALGQGDTQDAPPQLREFVAKQAAKRVAVRFRPTRTVTWDHRKLGGVY